MEHEAVLCGYDFRFIWNLRVIHEVPVYAGMTVLFRLFFIFRFFFVNIDRIVIV